MLVDLGSPLGERHAQNTSRRTTGLQKEEEEEEMDEGDKEDTTVREYASRRPHRREIHDAGRRQRMPCGNSSYAGTSAGVHNTNIVDAKADAVAGVAAAAAAATAAAASPLKTYQNHVQKARFDNKR